MIEGEKDKPNCYDCKWRGKIAGDAHSCCNHPEVKQDTNTFGALVEMLQGKSMEAAKTLNIQGNPTGIKRGWFMWPANFDPTWLISCNGFEQKEEVKDGGQGDSKVHEDQGSKRCQETPTSRQD